MKPEFVDGCPCRDCTGKGLGWIKHKTKGAVWRARKKAYGAFMLSYYPERPR